MVDAFLEIFSESKESQYILYIIHKLQLGELTVAGMDLRGEVGGLTK
jgi:hypothetical protein